MRIFKLQFWDKIKCSLFIVPLIYAIRIVIGTFAPQSTEDKKFPVTFQFELGIKLN